jgi:hypothetical protein
VGGDCPDYRAVLAAADTLSELMRKIGDKKAVFHRVLPHGDQPANSGAAAHLSRCRRSRR